MNNKIYNPNKFTHGHYSRDWNCVCIDLNLFLRHVSYGTRLAFKEENTYKEDDIYTDLTIRSVHGYQYLAQQTRISCVDTVGANEPLRKFFLQLRPLSKAYSFLSEKFNNDYFDPEYDDLQKIKKSIVFLENANFQEIGSFDFDTIELLLRYDFDIYGLIEKGFAIDMTLIK